LKPGSAAWRDSNAKVGPGRPGALSPADKLFLTFVRLRLDLKERRDLEFQLHLFPEYFRLG